MKRVLLLLPILLLSGCLSMPSFGPSKAELKTQLTQTKNVLAATQADLDAIRSAQVKSDAVIKALNTELTQKQALSQTAADNVAVITATNEIVPPTTRKDIVIDGSAKTAALALPAPTNYALVLAETKQLLNDQITSNAELQRRFDAVQVTIKGQKEELDKTTKTLTQANNELTEAKGVIQTLQNQLALVTKQAKEKIEAVTASFIDKLAEWKYFIGGITLLVGLGILALGILGPNVLAAVKGVVIILVATVGMIIPVTWYLWSTGALIVSSIVYLCYHWHKEKTIADNCVGAVQEAKDELAKVSPEAKAIVTKYLQSYWGTAEKDVSKANKWVDDKLKKLNLK